MPTSQLPEWIQRRFKMSQKNLSTLSRRRGKDLKVIEGLDMEGL